MDDKLNRITEAIEDKLGRDIVTLDVRDRNTFGDYFIIATGNNPNQTRAIADNVEEVAEKEGFEIRGIEGYRPGNWILCDLNDIIVHIFMPEDRKYYDLERLWE